LLLPDKSKDRISNDKKLDMENLKLIAEMHMFPTENGKKRTLLQKIAHSNSDDMVD